MFLRSTTAANSACAASSFSYIHVKLFKMWPTCLHVKKHAFDSTRTTARRHSSLARSRSMPAHSDRKSSSVSALCPVESLLCTGTNSSSSRPADGIRAGHSCPAVSVKGLSSSLQSFQLAAPCLFHSLLSSPAIWRSTGTARSRLYFPPGLRSLNTWPDPPGPLNCTKLHPRSSRFSSVLLYDPTVRSSATAPTCPSGLSTSHSVFSAWFFLSDSPRTVHVLTPRALPDMSSVSSLSFSLSASAMKAPPLSPMPLRATFSLLTPTAPLSPLPSAEAPDSVKRFQARLRCDSVPFSWMASPRAATPTSPMPHLDSSSSSRLRLSTSALPMAAAPASPTGFPLRSTCLTLLVGSTAPATGWIMSTSQSTFLIELLLTSSTSSDGAARSAVARCAVCASRSALLRSRSAVRLLFPSSTVAMARNCRTPHSESLMFSSDPPGFTLRCSFPISTSSSLVSASLPSAAPR
mmetsp:Transcript_22849/g.77753  ORF Transcript_22849/g.77753 Transcript_22849/m.77753 type:complete len:464 (+) Transcript_22849:446-1837(+)